jgi:hypothetical protein
MKSSYFSKDVKEIEGVEYPFYFIGLRQLIQNKKAVKRHKDSEDLDFLTKIEK